VLARSRFRLPLQVLAPNLLDDGSAYLFLLNPTGGIVGGDRLETEILVRKGAHVCLTTPSATAVYRALNLPAIQRTTIQLEEDSVLEYLPEHVIPYAGSALVQSVDVEMAPRSCLILSEAFSAGRIARGERWTFKELANHTEVRMADSLVYLNKARIIPVATRPDCLGIMEDFNYAASLVVFADGFNRWKCLVDELLIILDSASDLERGISLTGRSGCVVRLLASTASNLTRVTQDLSTCIRKFVLNALPLPRRKY